MMNGGFQLVDIAEALTESGRARKYWSDLKTGLTEEGLELSAKIGQLKLTADDGKNQRLKQKENTQF